MSDQRPRSSTKPAEAENARAPRVLALDVPWIRERLGGVDASEVTSAIELIGAAGATPAARPVVAVVSVRIASDVLADRVIAALRTARSSIRLVAASGDPRERLNGEQLAPFDAAIDPAMPANDLVRKTLGDAAGAYLEDDDPEPPPQTPPETRGSGEPPEISTRMVATPSPGARHPLLDPDEALASPAPRAEGPIIHAGPVSAEDLHSKPAPGEMVGDRAIVEALSAGRSVVRAALPVLRRRLGRTDVRIMPARVDGGGAARLLPDTRLVSAPIKGRRRVVGHLFLERSATSDADAGALRASLETHAAWLASWLRLAERLKDARRAASTDPLTGALNRRAFVRFVNRSIERAKRERLPLTVLFFDVDGFKAFNDDYGHEAGDQILIEMVRVLESVVRPTDRVCRIGGDEFAVVFFEPEGPRRAGSHPPTDVQLLATRVQDQIRRKRFPVLGEAAVGRLTISGGLATYPWDGADCAALLRHADRLAMQSKRSGKNAITIGPSG